MGQAGVVAGLCPITEANLGDGIFDGPGFASAGGRFGVGSDSNVLIGVSDELRQLEYAQRLGRRERNIMNRAEGASAGRALFDAALAGGLHALGTVSAAGIAVGAPADFVSLDPTNPALVGRSGDRLLDGWIFAARSSPVDCVWVAGKKLVSGGRHIAREDAARDFARVVGRLIAGDPA
jgi:cytosine/adenosine deaminase-related metal-dependent hydrolase